MEHKLTSKPCVVSLTNWETIFTHRKPKCSITNSLPLLQHTLLCPVLKTVLIDQIILLKLKDSVCTGRVKSPSYCRSIYNQQQSPNIVCLLMPLSLIFCVTPRDSYIFKFDLSILSKSIQIFLGPLYMCIIPICAYASVFNR